MSMLRYRDFFVFEDDAPQKRKRAPRFYPPEDKWDDNKDTGSAGLDRLKADTSSKGIAKNQKIRAANGKRLGLVHVGGRYWAPEEDTIERDNPGRGEGTHKLDPNNPDARATHIARGQWSFDEIPLDDKASQQDTADDDSESGSDSSGTPNSEPTINRPDRPDNMKSDELRQYNVKRHFEDKVNRTVVDKKTGKETNLYDPAQQRTIRNLSDKLVKVYDIPWGAKRKAEVERIVAEFGIVAIPVSRDGDTMDKYVCLAVEANGFNTTKLDLSRSQVFGKPEGQTRTSSMAFLMNHLIYDSGVTVDVTVNDIAAVLGHRFSPDFGKGRSASEDPNVNEVFQSSHALRRFDRPTKSLIAPRGSDGNILFRSDQHSKEYLAHSITQNKSLTKAKDYLRRVAVAPHIGAPEEEYKTKAARIEASRTITAVENHEARMAKILENFDYTSPEDRAKAVMESYGDLALNLVTIDQRIANSTMKNLAELAMYDSEIARGDEVYYPSDKSFPVGDKILVTREGTKIKRIDAVSVKYGKRASVFGFPSQTSKLQLFGDEKYIDLLSNSAGQAGTEIGIGGQHHTELSAFTQLFNDSGMLEMVSPDMRSAAIDALHAHSVKLKNIIRQFSNEKRKSQAAHTAWRNKGGAGFPKPPKIPSSVLKTHEYKAATKELTNLTNEIFTEEKLAVFLGTPNHNLLKREALSIYSIMGFSAVLKSSNGLDEVLHAHQSVTDNGQTKSYTYETKQGTEHVRDWSLGWHPIGENGAGLTASFSSEQD